MNLNNCPPPIHMIPCCQEDIKKILHRLPPLSSPLAASSPLVALALFICLFDWLLHHLAASLHCITSRHHITLRCVVVSRLVSSRLVLPSRLVLTLPLVLSSRLFSLSRLLTSHLVGLRLVASCRVPPTIGDSQLCFVRCDAVEDEGYLVPSWMERSSYHLEAHRFLQ